MTGGSNPRERQTASIVVRIVALAMCEQFHVRRWSIPLAPRGSLRSTATRFADDQIGDEQIETVASIPPVPGDLLMSRRNEVTTGKSREAAGYGRLKIDFWLLASCPMILRRHTQHQYGSDALLDSRFPPLLRGCTYGVSACPSPAWLGSDAAELLLRDPGSLRRKSLSCAPLKY